MSNPWVNADGRVAHPNSPSGGGGGGSFSSQRILGNQTYNSHVPHPQSPAARYLMLSNDDKQHLIANSRRHHVMASAADIASVLRAVRLILESKEVPEEVPASFRDALEDLSNALVDRFGDRKLGFDHAIERLTPVLAAADADSSLASLKRALSIDRLIGQWLTVCSWGAAVLPKPELHAKYEYYRVAEGGETIGDVAASVGLESFGPMRHAAYGYAANMRLAAGDKVYVPFPPDRLENLIDTFRELIKANMEDMKEVAEMLEKSNKEYERALCVADALTLGAGLMKGGAKLAIAKVVRKGALREGVARGFSKNYAKMVRHEFAELVREEIDDSAAEVVAFATGAAPLTHNVGYLVARHALGIKSKVYWFELATALYLGNWKVWLYGPEAIAEARIEKMKMEIAPHIFELRLAIELMSNQLESSIYAED